MYLYGLVYVMTRRRVSRPLQQHAATLPVAAYGLIYVRDAETACTVREQAAKFAVQQIAVAFSHLVWGLGTWHADDTVPMHLLAGGSALLSIIFGTATRAVPVVTMALCHSYVAV